MIDGSLQDAERAVEPATARQGQEPSENTQGAGREVPAVSVTPLFPGGASATKASVSIASMMAVALLGTLTLGQNPQTLGSSPLGDEFGPRVNAGGSDIPNGRVKQESLGISSGHFLKRKLRGFSPSSDSDEEEQCAPEGEPMDTTPDHEDPDDLDNPLYAGDYLELPKVDVAEVAPKDDAPVPALSTGFPANGNISAESLEALCDRMDFTSVK